MNVYESVLIFIGIVFGMFLCKLFRELSEMMKRQG